MTQRDELLTAVRTRLQRVGETRSLAAALEPAAGTEARALTEAVGDTPDPQAAFALGWLHWYRHRGLADDAELDASANWLTQAFVAGAGVDHLPRPLLPTLAERAYEVASAELFRLSDAYDREQVAALIALWQRIVQATPDDQTRKWTCLANLGGALRLQFTGSGVLADLDSAIVATEAAAAGMPSDAPAKWGVTANLGVMLQGRYERSGVPADLDRAIAALEEAAALAGEAADTGVDGVLVSLGNALRIRYDRDGAEADLSAAMAVTERVLARSPSDASALGNLGIMLGARFERHGAPADIDRSVELLRSAVAATPAGFPNRCGRLASLSNALRLRHSYSGSPRDLDEAIEVGRAAVDAVARTDPSRGMFLSNLAAFLQIRADRTGSADDLDRAIEAAEAAVAVLPHDSPHRRGAVTNLGRMLRDRSRRGGSPDDLDSAIALLERSVTAAGSARERARALGDLAMMLSRRAQATGSGADLDRAIESARTAARTAPDEDPDRAEHLSRLGVLLRDRYLTAGVESDLDEAVEASRAAVDTGHPDARTQANHLSNLAAMLDTRFQRTGAPYDVEEAMTVARAAVDLAPADDPHRPVYLSNLTAMHQSRFDLGQPVGDLDSAIDSLSTVLETTSRTDSQRSVYVRNLAALLDLRYGRTRSKADLDDAIARIEAVADLVPAEVTTFPEGGDDATATQVAALLRDEHAVRARQTLARLHLLRGGEADREAAMCLYRVCFLAGATDIPTSIATWVAEFFQRVPLALLARAFQGEAPPHVLEALPDMCRRIVDALPADHATRGEAVYRTAMAHFARFQFGGSLPSLDTAIDTLRDLLDSMPPDDPDRAGRLSMLGNLYGARYERTGDIADLTPAVDAARAAAEATGQVDHLYALVAALQNRYQGSGSSADLDEAVDISREILRHTPDDDTHRLRRLTMLADLLRHRYEHRVERADLDEAIALGQRLAREYPDDGAQAEYLGDLAKALEDRYELTGDLADLNLAVEHRRTCVRLAAGRQVRAGALSGLGSCLRLRFRRTGSTADLNEAIDALRTAVGTTPSDHRLYASRLYRLAIALRLRFERTGALTDADEAVELARSAVERTPPGDTDTGLHVSGLGTALLMRYLRGGADSDLDEAIEAHERALADTPPGRLNHARFVSNLAMALWARYERTREPADLSAAIDSARTALAATPPGSPDHPWQAANLGEALRSRYRLTRDPADLDAAIDQLRTAVDGTPSDHPQRTVYLCVLADLLRHRDGQAAPALSLYEEAARSVSATPSLRVKAAASAASLLGLADPARAAALLEDAVRLLPEVAPRHMRRSDQQYALQGTSGLAADAAALTLAAGHEAGRGADRETAERALRLLEAGRGVLLSQVLDTRRDHTDLRASHPGLADRYERLRDLLDQPLDEGPAAPQERHRRADEFTALLEEIRAQDGFASFGLPPTVDELLAETAHGPVVAFNVSRYRSDALLLTRDGITALALPGLDQDTLAEQVDSFYAALRGCTDPDADPTSRRAAQARIHEVLAWLWDSAAEPVLRALGHTSSPGADDAWPRVWWMPGGLLGLLPLHAAGHHRAEPRRTVMDRVISSYTPTVQALRHARRRPSAPPGPPGPPRALIVAMPTTPEVPGQLRHVPAETAMLKEELFHPVLLEEPAPGTTASAPLPTKANVLARLPGCPIAHFACHGASDPADPSRSRLLLHDHDSDPLTVAGLAPVRLDHVQLAYLSACRTAVTDIADLADESIHLTSAFQLAGYPHVIGTLWEINDMIAVEVAGRFYRALHAGRSVPDVSDAADALHHAVRAVRDKYPALPSLWAAYLHAGA
ncbi:CHAT domain-containing protein [Streptomyces sp. 7R007]